MCSCGRSRPRSRSRTSRCASSPGTTRCSAPRPTDADGHALSIPACRAARAGSRRRRRRLRRQGRLRLPRSALTAFDLTDRGVKGRAAPAALDAFLFTERGVYRSGETVFLTALLRDAKGAAVQGLPLTIVVQRPGRRRVSPRPASRTRASAGVPLALPLLSARQRGTWRVQAFADPKGPAIGETSFLVEDYVPERLEVTLKPAEALSGRPAGARSTSTRAILYGAPGAGLDVTGDVTVEPTAERPDGPRGLHGRPAGRDVREPDRPRSRRAATTDAKGHAACRVPVDDVTAPRPLEAQDRAARRRDRRPRRRAHRDLADLPQAPRDRREEALRTTDRREARRRTSTCRGGRSRRRAHGEQGRRIGRSSRRQGLPMVHDGRPLAI